MLVADAALEWWPGLKRLRERCWVRLGRGMLAGWAATCSSRQFGSSCRQAHAANHEDRRAWQVGLDGMGGYGVCVSQWQCGCRPTARQQARGEVGTGQRGMEQIIEEARGAGISRAKHKPPG